MTDNAPASPRDAALLYLATADLPAAAFRAGVKLLIAADSTTGYLRCTPEQAGKLCGNVAPASVRRILGQLQAQDVIHYSTNGDIHIAFRSWSTNTPMPAKAHTRSQSAHRCAENDHGCAENDHPCAKNDHDGAGGWLLDEDSCAENDHGCAENDHPCAKNAHLLTRAHAHAQSVSKYSDLPIPNDHTDLLTPDPNHDGSVAAALLIDAGMDKAFAYGLAKRHSLERIRRAVGWWWDDQQTERPHFKRRPAIVMSWLQEDKGLPPLSEAFESSELFRRHRTAAELAAGDADGMSSHQRRLRSRYIPDEYADIILG